MPETTNTDPLVDRLALLLCDGGCDPGPCHDSVSEAGRMVPPPRDYVVPVAVDPEEKPDA